MSNPTFQHPVALGRIDYMNVAPVYYGLDNGLATQGNRQGINQSIRQDIRQDVRQNIRLVSGPPSSLNQMMIDGSLDISPVSSAAYARNADEWLILPDLAIACRERVLSVLLVSRCSLASLAGRRILITDESASARDLCRLIFSLKGVRPEFVVGKIKSPSQLPEGIDAALVIGDSALSQPWGRMFPHIYDLGTLWWQMTGLPFVFAVWVVRKTFACQYPERVEAVMALLKTSRGLGSENMESIIEKACGKLGIDVSTARLYYESLVYHMADREKEGLELFYKSLHQTGITDRAAPLFFFGDAIQKPARQAPVSYAESPARSFNLERAGCSPAG
jgi:chorismate dehydratase